MDVIGPIIAVAGTVFIALFVSIFVIEEGVRRGMRKARAEERAELADMEAFENDEEHVD
ncbi:hypothetical protein [Brevibacterium aurantiacum]|uniref:hypothetical protein n=1 Tax=Brevibacterium aurantiacum TaxID=273384 RepID=UPI0013DDE166|nr:hypothetical protein [Brevibacterium aurantiacum]